MLSLAHDHVMAGHLGINKTYKHVLQNFFCLMVKYCNSCLACQMAEKPNHGITPAPLCPEPAMGEHFQYLLLDCVGPLLRIKSGNQYLLTIICISTLSIAYNHCQSVSKGLIYSFGVT